MSVLRLSIQWKEKSLLEETCIHMEALKAQLLLILSPTQLKFPFWKVHEAEDSPIQITILHPEIS